MIGHANTLTEAERLILEYCRVEYKALLTHIIPKNLSVGENFLMWSRNEIDYSRVIKKYTIDQISEVGLLSIFPTKIKRIASVQIVPYSFFLGKNAIELRI